MNICEKTSVAAFLAACAAFGAFAIEPFTIDFSQDVGVIKKLNGVCNAAPLFNAFEKSLDGQVKRLEIPCYRFHDAALENPGIQLVDVSRIFPLMSADADKPENYDFRATDDYLKQVVETGAEIDFRLGESIEHSKRKYYVNDPVDYEKWADICCHIIRHYNEGWANGYKWNIRRWSIWEEPCTNPSLLTGKPDPFKDIYLPLYAAAARRIKREFPSLKIGGPQCFMDCRMKEFIDYCAENRLPIDFYGFTGYERKPERYARTARELRQYLDEKGFKDTEIALVEWHWGPTSWRGCGTLRTAREEKAYMEELTGGDSTAFTVATLIALQDSPVARAYYYSMKFGEWGLFDAANQPYGSYYAMLAFAQLAHGETRVAAMTSPSPGWYFLASKEKATGRGRILIAALRTDGTLTPITLKGGVKPVSVKVIDPAHDLEEVEDWRWDAPNNALYIPRDYGDSDVWLVETEPVK